MGVMRCRCDLWGYDGIIAPVCVVDVAVMGYGGYGGCYGGYGGYDGVIHQFV